MPFSIATIFTISALWYALASPTPLIASNETTIISASKSELYFSGSSINMTVDDVISTLQASGKISWTPSGTGHYVDISQDIWEGAHNSTQHWHANNTKRGLDTRTTIGDVGIYSASAACYGWGSVQFDTSIDSYIIDACDGLVASALPPLAVNALRVWQSGGLSDAAGIASYIRFSTKLLTKGFSYDTTLCQEAMRSFDNYCQKISGQTQGGEITVGEAMMFNADPTELKCNC